MHDIDRRNLKAKLLDRSEYADDGCLMWLGCCGSHGYGQLNFNYQGMTTHRAAYEVFKGPIPTGMMVLHKCDNKRCINPEHLFVGTAQDNVDDMIAKGRGDLQNSLKLDDETVRRIRLDIDTGYSYTTIARRNNTSGATISRIKHGHSYWWVE